MTVRTAALVAIAALAALALVALAIPPNAGAGVYRAAQCDEANGAGHADAAFSHTSDRYVGTAACRAEGLSVVHISGSTPTHARRHGAWTLTAPSGTEMLRASVRVSAASQGWHVPQIVVGLAGGAKAILAGVRGRPHSVAWAGTGGRSLVARLVCANPAECGPGRGAYIRARRIVLTLRDSLAPTLGLGGSLTNAGSRRGAQALDVALTDAGSGVRSIAVVLNGKPLASRTLACALTPGGLAVRLRPCPADPTVHFDVATATGQFRQGLNRLRACASDYSPTTNVNSACVDRVVRIDNLCPVSDVAGAHLVAHFEGGGSRTGVASGDPARVSGRLTDSDGRPVADAEICVAARPRTAGASERVLATPRTGEDGGFRAQLPAGPSSEIRVAHWPDSDHALERYLDLAVRARPSFRLEPGGTLHNGDRVHFRVHLPAPANASRRLEVEARSNGHWIHVASGRSDRGGDWSGSYRFHATTKRRTYAFRAIVPRQAGYPYEAGRSDVRRVEVRG